MFLRGSSPLPSAPYLFPSLPPVSWRVQPGKFINLYSMLLALKRRVPKKKINFPVLDLGFHHFSPPPPHPAHSVPFPSLFSSSLSSCCPPLQPWKWGKISEKLRKRSWKVARGHGEGETESEGMRFHGVGKCNVNRRKRC